MKSIYFSHFTPSTRDIKKDTSRVRLNEEILSKEIRVVDNEGKMLGIMTKREALILAEEKHFDLIEIAPNANPPVCRIMEYNKFIYEQQKKEKQQRKHQQQQQMKEIRFKPNIQIHDFTFKTRHARQFIEDGNKVKGVVMFRGREITHQEFGKELLQRFVVELEDIAKVDSPPKFEGKAMTVVLAPDKTKKKK